MMFETSAMTELHKIREQIYEETKNMSDEEFIEFIRKEAEKVKEEIRLLKEETKKQVN
ncbi:hypothetical protein [Anaerocellum diazotrophicum]|uniref:Uncharacterized protein n=1 Tax=Caldicellulosiruptor diazotrophicus TaxID=2806205 RepID=A0ABN6E7K6_9FIRM|nr:hypothetical protein [Caldicellulosiruptor diazotrophicus]BCS80059.1 hypothetical protein CaldiYA01_00190 [Caldicellulosiruptor diazotrophicus]